MRISDSFRYKLFQMNVSKVGQQLDDIEKKISTQKNINTSSDDPIRYATNILYDAERSLGNQYSNNLQRLSTMISMYDVSFGSISSQLDNLAKLANNFGTLDQDLKFSAIEQLEGMIEQFVTIGNTKLGNSYIFGGQQADVPPFQLNNDYSVRFTVGQQGEDATNIFVDKAQTGQYGISGRQAFFSTSKIAFGDVTNAYAGDVYSNTDSFAYVINGTNNTIQMNGATVTLSSGVYTGGGLAKEIERQLGTLYVINDTNNTLYRNGTAVSLANGTYTGAALAAQVATQLGTGYAAAYNGANKTFSITNGTGGNVTFNWSNAGATAADVLGFDRQDSVVTNLGSDASDHSVAGFTPVAFDSATRKFDITNNTGADVTFNWLTASAASVLGFDAINSVVVTGKSDISDIDSGRKSFLIETATSGATTGALGSRATYRYSTDGGATWSAGLTVNTGGADTTADIIITTGVNDTLYLDNIAVPLTSTIGGTAYTGDDLAIEIQTQLNLVRGGHTVNYSAETRKFTITNNTGVVETFNWSNAGANAAGVLGFDNVDSVVSNGTGDVGDYDAGMFIDGAGVVNVTNNRIKLLFSTGAMDDISIDATNNTLYLNGSTAVNLNSGTYTGSELATEIQIRLNAVQTGHTVTYDALTRRFSITNNTGAVETYNWSNPFSTASRALGFDTGADSTVNNGASDVSDYNTGTTDNLSAGDTFHVKDLSIFELLKNLRDAFEADNSTWVFKNTKYINAARSLTTKNNSILAFQGALAKTLTENNKTKEGKILTLQADLVNADMSELATQFNVLLNTYQALLSTLARMQSVSILNYLK